MGLMEANKINEEWNWGVIDNQTKATIRNVSHASCKEDTILVFRKAIVIS
jgi:hypothetical protein